MLISQLCSIIIFCFHLLSQSAADAGRLVCVIQQFALADSDKGAMSCLGQWGMRGVREGGGRKFSMERNGILNKSLSALCSYHSGAPWQLALGWRKGQGILGRDVRGPRRLSTLPAVFRWAFGDSHTEAGRCLWSRIEQLCKRSNVQHCQECKKEPRCCRHLYRCSCPTHICAEAAVPCCLQEKVVSDISRTLIFRDQNES